MCDRLPQIITELETQGRKCDRVKTDNNRSFFVVWGQIQIDGYPTYPCDTVVLPKIIDQNQANYSEYILFVTFICEGLNGNAGKPFNKAVDKLNYDCLGKFVRDYTDGSQDILYVTSECLSNLTTEVVKAHLFHHAKVKATFTPTLEKLRDCQGKS